MMSVKKILVINRITWQSVGAFPVSLRTPALLVSPPDPVESVES